MFSGLSVLLFSWGLVIDDVHVTYLVTCLPFLESGPCETTTVAVRAYNHIVIMVLVPYTVMLCDFCAQW